MGEVVRILTALTLSVKLAFAGGGLAAAPYGFVAEQRGANLVSGTTIFDQSELATPADGYAVVFFTGSRARVDVYGDSRVGFGGSADSPTIELIKGGVRLATESAGAPLQIHVSGASIRLQGRGPGEAEVKLISPNRFSVAAVASPAVVEIGGEAITVPKGLLYDVQVAAPGPQGPTGAGGESAKRRRRLLILGGVLIGGITGIGIYLNNRGHAVTPSGVFVSPAVP